MRPTIAAAAVLILTLCATKLNAEVVAKSGTFSGIKVNYKVVLPNGYDPAKTYPAILGFAGGSQEMRIVDGVIKDHFKSEAERRGYIVIIPAAPNGELFFEGGDRIFPAFLEQMLRDYKIENGKFHIAGRSNGGLSAFHIAASYPQYFRSLTSLPGYLPDASPMRVRALAKMCINMYAGEMDTDWLESEKAQAAQFRAQGFVVQFSVEKAQGHVMRTLEGPGAGRLFKQFEQARHGCGK